MNRSVIKRNNLERQLPLHIRLDMKVQVSQVVDIVRCTYTFSVTSHSQELQGVDKINEIPITMELDTMAGVRQVIRTRTSVLHFGLTELPKETLDFMGSCTVKVSIHGKTA